MTELDTQAHPDEDWISTLPFELRGAARVHGRALTVFVLNSTTYHAGIQVLLRRTRGNRELIGALQGITTGVADLSQAYCTVRGWTQLQLSECQQDLQRAMLLANSTGEEKSNGGIILGN